MALEPSGWTGSILAGLLASAVWGVLVVLLRQLQVAAERRRPVIRVLIAAAPVIFFVGANAGIHERLHAYYLPVLIVSAIGLTGLFALELSRYWAVGLVGVDRKLGSGIDPKRSLELCQSSLEFLGVGASKLTATGQTFEDAVRRCNRPDKPVRFLLCRPEHPELERIARNAGVGVESYRSNVKRSLDYIAGLKQQRQWNIEVRFYANLPLFRLMFIDEQLCLASHYYFGEGDGTQLPQLHIVRSGLGRDTASLYFPMHLYFQQLWDVAEPWEHTAT